MCHDSRRRVETAALLVDCIRLITGSVHRWKIHLVDDTVSKIFSTDRINGDLGRSHLFDWPAANKAFGIKNEPLIQSVLFEPGNLLIVAGEHLHRCVSVEPAMVMLIVNPLVVLVTPLACMFDTIEFTEVVRLVLQGFERTFADRVVITDA